jgi:integrase
VRVAGKRIFRRYTTAQDAEDFAAGLRSQRQKEGQAAFSITAPLRVEAAECAELLAPHGATIREACKWYERHVLKYRNAPIINEIVDKLIADAVAAGRRDKTVADLHYRLGAVVKTFGKRKLSEITVEELQAWSNNPSLSAQSRRHMLTKLSQLYRYAERRGWSEKNIVPYLNRPDVEDGEPGFLAVDDCARLLKHAPDFNLLPYIALSLFCGIRVAELRRLTWGKVKIVERVILIDGAVAKTKARRVIEINDTALAWLATCAKNSGLVVDPANFRKRLDALRKAAKLVKDWPDNALRHTAATYAYALTQDAVRVSGMLGNSPDVLHRHYRGLATKHEAEQFFALRPTADTAEKIKTMKVVNS